MGAIAVALLLGACISGLRGDVDAARSLAIEYFEAIAGGAPDRGWSLILPDSLRAYRDQAQYIDLAEAADWEAFSWNLANDGHYCEDAGAFCVVRLEVASAAVPSFLLEAPRSAPDDLLRTIQMDDDPVSPGNAEVVVYFAINGERGILLGGG